jgi:hypothetical protein
MASLPAIEHGRLWHSLPVRIDRDQRPHTVLVSPPPAARTEQVDPEVISRLGVANWGQITSWALGKVG